MRTTPGQFEAESVRTPPESGIGIFKGFVSGGEICARALRVVAGVLPLVGAPASARASDVPGVGGDVFGVEDGVPKNPAAPLLDESLCAFGTPGRPLSLPEAVARALCANPKTRQSWAAIKTRAAAVGVAAGAFLPTLSSTWQDGRDRTSTMLNDHPEYDSDTMATPYSGSVSLSWVLYDFGGRQAAHENAADLLAAAQATHQATLQTVFDTVAKDYYAAQAARGAWVAAVETERMARDSLAVATHRVDRGVAPVSDALQAETALDQARLALSKAESDGQDALGQLAVDMALRPDTPLDLPEVGAGVEPDDDFRQSVAALIDEAVRHHPALRAVQAQAQAAQAEIRQTEAEGLPSVSLIGHYSRDTQPIAESLGLPTMAATRSDYYAGLQLTIPLFEGFSRTYKIHAARAEAERQRAAVDETRDKIALDVWTAYQALTMTTRNLGASAELLRVAQRSFDAAQNRYRTGVGSMIELLNAQSAVAGARRQRIRSLTDWRASRLDLAASLGRLDISMAEGP